jgi:hypothetical protein
MCRMESSLTPPGVVRGAEKLRSGHEVVGLQPAASCVGIPETRHTPSLSVDARHKSLSSGRAKRGPAGRARR